MEHRQGISREQVSLFPESIEDLIPGDHLIRVIDLYIDGLDLKKLGFGKSQTAATGRRPYHPGDLLKLYLYGYLNRVRSSRRLEAECRRNIEVMWLLRRLAPDHKTIANFRKDEGRSLQAVCRDFVQFCRRAGLVAGEVVAIDGSKFQAVASRDCAITDKDLARKEEALNAKIAAYLAQLDVADDDRGERVNGGAVQAALTLLQSEQAQMQAQRQVFKGTRRTHQIDGEADARLVKDGQGRSIAGYNVQSAVDSKHKLIVHHEVVCEGNDLRQLLPMAQAVKQVLEQTRLCVVADAGYSNDEHLTACEADGIIPYVALARAVNPRGDGNLFDRRRFTYDRQRDQFTCPTGATLVRKQIHRTDLITIYAGVACQGCGIKSQCTTSAQRFVSRHFDEDSFARTLARLNQHPQIMRLRGAIVEHPFGNLKRWIFGNGRYLVRGIDKVRGETALAIIAYNLRRMTKRVGGGGGGLMQDDMPPEVRRWIAEQTEGEPDTGPKERMHVRFTQTEYQGITSRAEAEGCSPQRWVINCVRASLTHEPQFTMETTKALWESSYQLRAIGRNLNQIAKRLNEGKPANIKTEQMEKLATYIYRHTDKVAAVQDASLSRWGIQVKGADDGEA